MPRKTLIVLISNDKFRAFKRLEVKNIIFTMPLKFLLFGDFSEWIVNEGHQCNFLG